MRLRSRIALSLAAALASACGAPSPDADREGGPADAELAPGCGNGILERFVAPGVGETCDDGARNGSPESLCSFDCQDRSFEMAVRGSFLAEDVPRVITLSNRDFSFPHTLFSPLELGTGCTLMARFDGSDEPYLMKVDHGRSATGVAAAVRWDRDVAGERVEAACVETRGEGEPSAHLYLTTPSQTPPYEPIVEEVPYPLEGTNGGELYAIFDEDETGAGWELILLDIRPSKFSTFVGSHWKIPEDVWITTELGPVPSGTEVATAWLTKDRSPAPHTNRIAHHYNDPPWLVVHEVDSFAVMKTVYDGPAPENVVGSADADFFRDLGILEEQLAVLRVDGQVEIWSLSDGRLTTQPFGKVAPGSRAVSLVEADSGNSLNIGAIEPDGEIVVLANNGQNQALRPQRFSIDRTCEVCTFRGGLLVYDEEFVRVEWSIRP